MLGTYTPVAPRAFNNTFVDPDARWILNERNRKGVKESFFKFFPGLAAGKADLHQQGIAAVLHFNADASTTCTIILNNVTLDTKGAGEQGSMNVTIQRGMNLLQVDAINAQGPSRILFSIISADGLVLARSDESWSFVNSSCASAFGLLECDFGDLESTCIISSTRLLTGQMCVDAQDGSIIIKAGGSLQCMPSTGACSANLRLRSLRVEEGGTIELGALVGFFVHDIYMERSSVNVSRISTLHARNIHLNRSSFFAKSELRLSVEEHFVMYSQSYLVISNLGPSASDHGNDLSISASNIILSSFSSIWAKRVSIKCKGDLLVSDSAVAATAANLSVQGSVSLKKMDSQSNAPAPMLDTAFEAASIRAEGSLRVSVGGDMEASQGSKVRAGRARLDVARHLKLCDVDVRDITARAAEVDLAPLCTLSATAAGRVWDHEQDAARDVSRPWHYGSRGIQCASPELTPLSETSAQSQMRQHTGAGGGRIKIWASQSIFIQGKLEPCLWCLLRSQFRR